MLPDPCLKAVGDDFEWRAVEVLRGEFDAVGANDVNADAWDGEAAFFVFVATVEWFEFWIDHGAVVAGFSGVVHDEEPEVESHLGGCESDAFFFAHDLEHSFDDSSEFGVEGPDGFASLFEAWIWIEHDLQGFGVHRGG